jgi:hypothetical protein
VRYQSKKDVFLQFQTKGKCRDENVMFWNRSLKRLERSSKDSSNNLQEGQASDKVETEQTIEIN